MNQNKKYIPVAMPTANGEEMSTAEIERKLRTFPIDVLIRGVADLTDEGDTPVLLDLFKKERKRRKSEKIALILKRKDGTEEI